MPERTIDLEILPVPIVSDHIPRRALRYNSTTIIHSIYAHMIAPEINTKLADFNIMLSQNQTVFFSPNLIAIYILFVLSGYPAAIQISKKQHQTRLSKRSTEGSLPHRFSYH